MSIIYKTELIEKYIKDNKISKAEFCKRCGISLRTLNKVLTNGGDIRATNAYKLAKLLHCYLNDFVII